MVGAAIVDANKRFVEAFFPHLDPAPFLNDHCLYTSTPDLDYVIDAVPGFPNVVLAGGGSGHAFKMGPAIGAAAAALALGLDHPFDLARFKIDRPGLRGGDVDAQRP